MLEIWNAPVCLGYSYLIIRTKEKGRCLGTNAVPTKRLASQLLTLTIVSFLAYTFINTADVYAQSQLESMENFSAKSSAQNGPASHGTVLSPADPAFPIKVSANNRYLVDQSNRPFLMVGDAPQTLIANLSQAQATIFIANRKKYGINTLWINILCNYSDGCNKDATTFDGIAPFSVPGDLSTPNPAYFRRADEMIRMAAESGMLVLLDPIETSSWLEVLRTNGVAKAFAYGQYLGTRYKDYTNIIWMHGNDFQSWENAVDDELVQAVARGILSADAVHIHTVELNYDTSGSLDNPAWGPLIQLDAAYTYYPTYAQVLAEYNHTDFKPVFMAEGYYEFEHTDRLDGGGSPGNLRRQEYWTMLSGATGQVYGSAYTWRLQNGWEAKLDLVGAQQIRYMKDFFISRRWYDLVPDQNHTLVTSGFDGVSGYIGWFSAWLGQGTGMIHRFFERVRGMSGIGSIQANSYVTASRTSDGTLAIAYLPSIGTITIDMSKMTGPTIAHWYDPTNGAYFEASSLSIDSSGKKTLFTPPGRNNVGDTDWVLVLEVLAAR